MSEHQPSSPLETVKPAAENSNEYPLVDVSCEIMLLPLNRTEEASEQDIKVTILDHRQIEVNGRQHEIAKSSAAILNFILENRDEYVSANDISLRLDCSNGYTNKRAAELIEVLTVGDQSLIESVQPKGGSVRYYRLLDTAWFYDNRQHWSEHEFFTRRYINYKDDKPLLNDGRLSFKTKEARVDVGAAMLQEFKEDPQVERAVTILMHEIAEAPPSYDQLPLETEKELFLAVEQAMTQFVMKGKHLIGSEREQVVSGVQALYQLFFYHTHALETRARRQITTGILWSKEDDAQEAAIALMESILRTPHEDNDKRFGWMLNTTLHNQLVTKWVETQWSLGQKRGIRVYRDYSEIRKSQQRLSARLGRTATIQEVAKDLQWSVKQIQKVVRQSNLTVSSLQRPLWEDGPTLEETIENEDFSTSIDFEIEKIAMQDDVQELFASQALTDNEKIVMSLYFGIFSTHLSGAEATSGRKGHAKKTVFTYPYDEESFLEVSRQTTSLSDLDKYFGLQGHSGNHLKAARPKAKAFLEEHGLSL